MNKHIHPADFEDCFHPPNGWTWGTLKRRGYQLRFGYVPSPTQPAKGTIICLPGLSEFCEKYFEVAHDCLSRGYNFTTLDWHGQGLSSRYLKNPQKRHSAGFDSDVDDLKAFLDANPFTDTPLYMLAHSMGGHIGLRFLLENPNAFKAAAFSAPMVSLHILEQIPPFIGAPLISFLSAILGNHYAPTGGNWSAEIRDQESTPSFSQDPVRSKIHNSWMISNPDLQVGHITNRWLYEARQSSLLIQKHPHTQNIKIPCLFGVAGKEKFVGNKAIRTLARALPNATLLELQEACHEIFMEKEEIRCAFMNKFYSLLTKAE